MLHYFDKFLPGPFSPKKRNQGNVALIAMLISGAGLAAITAQVVSLDGSLRKVQSDKKLMISEQTNVSSLSTVKQLFNRNVVNDADIPAVYPEPYFNPIGLNSATPGGANWVRNGDALALNTIDPNKINMAAVFSGGGFPVNSALWGGENSSVTLLGINTRQSVAFPSGKIADSIDVEFKNRDERCPQGENCAAMPAKYVTLKARIKLQSSKPPMPTCSLTANRTQVKSGESVKFTVAGSGVMTGAKIFHDGKSVASYLPGAATSANSVYSKNVVMLDQDLILTGSQYPSSKWIAKAKVIGPNGVFVECVATVEVTVTTEPCAIGNGIGGVGTLNGNACPADHKYIFANFGKNDGRGYDASYGGKLACYGGMGSPDCWPDERYSSKINCNIYASSPPDCSVFKLWKTRDAVGCFARDTLIRLADGSDRRIDELRRGQLLINPLTGGVLQIKDIVAGPEKKRLYKVALANGKSVEVTELHPFLTDRGLKSAAALKTGDIILGSGASAKVMAEKVVPEKVMKVTAIAGSEGRLVLNLRLVAESDVDGVVQVERDHVILANGIATGDLNLQEVLQRKLKAGMVIGEK